MLSEDSNLDSRDLLEPFSVSPLASIPPLSLFCPETQKNCLVFRTKQALLSPQECSSVLRIVDRHHTQNLGGKWGTVRHSSVKTTDVAVEDIPALRPWLLALLHSKIFPLLSVAFPKLADGTSLLGIDPDLDPDLDPATGTNTDSDTVSGTASAASRLRVHDAFIVRYDAENDKSLSLPEHCDTSCVSVILSLNEQDNDDDDNNNNNDDEKENDKENEEGRGAPGTIAVEEHRVMKTSNLFRIGELFVPSFLWFQFHELEI
jgi:hypothetical protein